MDDNVTIGQIFEAKAKLRDDIFRLIQEFTDKYGVYPEVQIHRMEVERIGEVPIRFPNVIINVVV